MPRYYPGNYTGRDDRRAQEERDAGMLPSSRGIANMPQEAVYKTWNSGTPINAPEGLDDKMSGIDKQIREDNQKKKGPSGIPF